MKTLEDLNNLTKAQLGGILQSLDVAVPKKAGKEQLVQLVYDVQQPDAAPQEPIEEEVAVAADKPILTEDMIENYKTTIEDHFGGVLEEAGTRDDGAIEFSVVDEDGAETAYGTLLELFDLAVTAPTEGTPLAFEEVPLNEVEETPPELTTDGSTVEKVKKALNALHPFGLRYEINGGAVKLWVGSKAQTTTLNQPAHRVVRIAETLCNVVR
mgnify:CR=1 FL=1